MPDDPDDNSSAIPGCGKGIFSTDQINAEAELRHDMFTARDLGMSLEEFRVPGRKAGKLGFDPADYGGMTTLQRMKKARRWLLWKSVPNTDPKKKPRKIPYYVNGEPRSGQMDTPEDVALFVSFEEAETALAADATMTGLGFALGLDAETGDHWQGADFDGSMNGIEKAPGYVEKSPSGNGYHAIGRGEHFKAHPTGDGFEAYCEKRYFTVTGLVENDGPLVDLTKTGLRKYLKTAANVHSEPLANGHDHAADTGAAANPLQAYIDAGEIPAGECDNVLTQFWGHAVRAVKLGHATVEQAALFMGRVNGRLAENKDKEFHGKFRRMLEKEGLPLPINVGKYASFDDGNPIQLLGPRLSQAEEGGLQYITKNRVMLDGEDQPPEFLLQDIILAGITTVVGYMGVGKTVSMLTLMLHVAGLMEVSGLPRSIRRKVLYLTEDDAQLRRLLVRWIKAGIINKPLLEVEEWFIPVRVTRRKPEEWKLTIQEFIAVEAAAHAGEAWWAVPAVVFDTGAASFNINKVEDNAEVSTLMSHLKLAAQLPDWPKLTVSILPVLHVPKHQRGSMAEEISAIGAQAWSADTGGTLIFSEDSETGRRLMTLGKKRFDTAADIKQWSINSELLSPVEMKTAWAAQYPDLAVYQFVAPYVTSFAPMSKTDLNRVKQAGKFEEKRQHIFGQIKTLMDAVRNDKKQGLAFFAPGRSGGDSYRPEGFEFVKWDDIYPTKSNNSATTNDNSRLRSDVLNLLRAEPFADDDRFVVIKLSIYDDRSLVGNVEKRGMTTEQ